jgi:UDP-N-acetylmuramoylalanine--D-glutamate ligase
MFENNKIFILGMARSGYEAAKVLIERNNQVLITDMKEQDADKVNELKNLGVKYIVSEKPEDLLDNSFDYIVKNPGITYEHPCILKANELGIKVINEVEVAYNLLPENVKIIGITGSNGKTTTTTLIYEFLRTMGKSVHLGGNIGFPLCSLVNKVKSGDILVLEISGHQLHDFINFKTDISVMTNLSEVHLDFFKTYENYKYNKTRIFDHHTNKDIAILNFDNNDVLASTENIASQKIYFSSTKKADAYIEDKAIYYKGERIIDINSIRVKGNHNYENIMCAVIATKEFGIENSVIEEVLNNFGGVEHRIEYVRKLNGREFYNDSKSTNVKSTQIALSAFDRPTIILLGGLDRGHSFDELESYMKNVKYIISFGETKNRIKDFADRVNVNCTVVEKLEDAVKVAYNFSDEGDVILLSPACASWDQYKCFEDRGKDFKKWVENLK